MSLTYIFFSTVRSTVPALAPYLAGALLLTGGSQATAATIRQEVGLADGSATPFLLFDSRFGRLTGGSFELLVTYDHVGELSTTGQFDGDFVAAIIETDYWAYSNLPILSWNLPNLDGGGDYATCDGANCRKSLSYYVDRHYKWDFDYWWLRWLTEGARSLELATVDVTFNIDVSTYCPFSGCPSGASMRGGLESYSVVGVMTYEYAQVPLPASFVPLMFGLLCFPILGFSCRRDFPAS